MRAVAARCSSRSPLSTPPRQPPPAPALLRTRSSPGRLNSSATQASSSPEVDSAAAYLASTFELSSTKTTANSQATTGTTKAGGATATTAFVGPSASSAAALRSLKSSIYGKAFELLDDGTLVESVVDPFGSLSLNGTSVAVGASEVKGKGKAKEEAEEVETVSSEFNPTATSPKLKPRDQLKPKRATSTPAFASVTEPKPVHPFFSRTQSAPASQIRIPPAKTTDEAKMPKVPVQRKVSAGSLSPKLSGAGTKSVATSPPPRSRGSAGGSSIVKKGRSSPKAKAKRTAAAALRDTEAEALSSMRPAEEEATSKTKTAVARGRTKATRSPKHVVDVSDFSTYTYKDPELALAYANVEVTPGAPEGEPERKPIEPMRWYITNADEAEDALTGLKGPVGFDMEWTVIFRRGVIPRKTALIQVADKTKIMLFHISRMSEFPRSLKRIIEDPTIVKTGVNITGDAKKLYGDWGIQAQGIVELAMLAWEVDKPTMQRHGFKTGWTTLANMVAMYTRRVLPKGAERTSDWEKPLNEEQLEYASNDAHCGLVIYNKLVAKAEEATIDLSKLRLNRMVEEGSEDTAPTENDGKAQEAEDAYAESVLASTSETQTQTEDQTEPEPQAASSSRARTSTRAPPCPSGVEYYRYRAYRMWYENPSLTLDEMCVRMRSAEQPLARTTVIGYVITTLECDTEKTLPFSKERLVALLREEPRSWQWNYKKITALGFTS